MTFGVLDLYGGPGGWSEAVRALGLREVGIDFDHDACRTAMAAGHVRVRADVASIPMEPFAGIKGHIGSPPCPTFSAAGKGTGRADLSHLLQAVKRLGAGEWPAEELAACSDPRTRLCIEPLRWALALRPEWIAWEQVKEVMPVWQGCAEVLREHGYSVATGCLQAEQYGVPQTRRRAVLLASRTREVALPQPTHTKYVKGKPRQAEGLLPWVSMEDVLGWGITHRPYPTLASSRTTGGPDMEKVGGSAARATIYAELAAGRWLATGTRPRAPLRRLDEPAPTLAFGHDVGSHVWVKPGTQAVDVAAMKKAGLTVRLNLRQAAVIQSFRSSYPWAGSKTKQFGQIANAVPPLLALACLEMLT